MPSGREESPTVAFRQGTSAGAVCVVDDDEAVRDSLGMLLESVGHEARLFGSANEFLDAIDEVRPGCLILDVRLPGMSGLDLQRELTARGVDVPIVFITGHGDVPMAVRAMQEGAVDFLEKPFKEQDLLDRVSQALRISDRRLRRDDEGVAIRRRLETLTPREREVLQMVVQGDPNKVIAGRLGTSRRTVEIHRSKVMHKMKADSLPHLVRMVLGLGEDGQAT